MKHFFIALILSFTAQANIFETGIPARANFPLAGIDGRISYQVFSGKQRHRISQCVLVHGYGVNQRLLDLFTTLDNIPLKGLNLDMDLGLGIAGQFMPPGYEERLKRLAKLDAVQAFGSFYFGDYLIRSLLNKACDNVIVIAQESVQSTALEMIVRTERFLRAVCERPAAPGQLACAVVAHGKGALVATSILRRCAEALPVRKDRAALFTGGSELGPNGCANIGEVYASAGNNEGALFPVIIAGSRRMADRKAELEKKLFGLVDLTKQFEEGVRKLQPLKDAEVKYTVDIFGAKTEDSNPFWYDLSPIAEIDGFGEADRKVGVPIALRHGPDFTLARGGWLRDVEYVAAGGGYRFDQTKYLEVEVEGIKRTHFDPKDANPLTAILPQVPPRPLLATREPRNPRHAQRRAEARAKLDFLWEPFTNGQILADQILRTHTAEVHGEAQGSTSLGWGLEDIAKYASDHGLKDDKGKTSYLKRFRFLPPAKADINIIAFQESDGLSERGTALGVCERGLTAMPEVRIVAECKVFPNTHHLGLTGMSKDVADHIVAQLSTRKAVAAPRPLPPAPVPQP